jgi:uncharacterized sulfatase
MRGLDLRNPLALANRKRIFTEVYQHDINIDKLNDLEDGLVARVVIEGWDKLIAGPAGNKLYDLKRDPDDRNDIAMQNPKKVQGLSSMLEDWLRATPPMVIR